MFLPLAEKHHFACKFIISLANYKTQLIHLVSWAFIYNRAALFNGRYQCIFTKKAPCKSTTYKVLMVPRAETQILKI